MADFLEVLKRANDGYHDRDDYPPFALVSWDDRALWNAYLRKINEELDATKGFSSAIESTRKEV